MTPYSFANLLPYDGSGIEGFANCLQEYVNVWGRKHVHNDSFVICATSEYQYIKEGGFGRLIEALNEIGIGRE